MLAIPFSPACREKGLDGTWHALAMAFSPCLSMKSPIIGLVVRLRWPFPPACRGKGLYRSKIRVSWMPFPSPPGEKANGHCNVSKKCTGTKLTDFIPSLRTQEEAMRLTSPAIARRARRQPGELALFPPLCSLRPHYEQKQIWTETPTKIC